MIKQIPEKFKSRMERLLGDEFTPFWQTYSEEAHQGLRVNTLKVDVDSFLQLTDFTLEPVPWCPTGFYYSGKDRPGKHPYHAAGLYYIQEPSAMSVVEYLQPRPGEVILDLCAAPGGKSTQIAAHMQGAGLLIANEIHPARVKALSENIERCGVTHCVVTNETPERLAERFPDFFDRILVDAPCSGEGMFRKLEEACTDWALDKVTHCASLQEEILDAAVRMLKPGGIMVYSTCTFSPEENEKRIAQFLDAYPDFELVDLPHRHGIQPGRPEWAGNREELSQTARLWPHRLRGEGHFAAKLQKKGGGSGQPAKHKPAKRDKPSWELWKAFRAEVLAEEIGTGGEFLLFGDHLYLLPNGMPSLDKLKVVRPGWHLGTVKKGRFEPSHALALGLKQAQVRKVISFPAGSPEVLRYLKGESIMVDESVKGWILVCVDQFPLGWGKVSAGQLKNHYPKGLRWT